MHAIANARYSSLLNDKEQLEQKYLHLSQIIESETTAKWQYSHQCEEFLAEIQKLRQEICHLKRQESRSNHLRLVLSKSAAIVETVMKQQRRRQQRQQRLNELANNSPSGSPTSAAPQAGTPGKSGRADADLAAGAAAGTNGTATKRDDRANHNLVTRQRSLATPTGRCAVVRSATSAGNTDPHQQHHHHHHNLMTSSPSPSPPPAASSLRAGGQSLVQLDDETAADEQALSVELKSVVEALNKGIGLSDYLLEVENSEEIRKIKKVQSFFRGWLCRRRWKQIVQEYIKSPHAECMRKRNNLVFRMVECEEEYVEQLTLLISAFLRPIKMAASSQRPALNHDELNSIFLNSETLLFLHQIFLKGLSARMESWPTLVLADLFNMLLPMLTIYQEYVRNHHFSLQVLAECKQREQFSLMLGRLEEKSQLNGRTLETFLTYPMHQVSLTLLLLLLLLMMN